MKTAFTGTAAANIRGQTLHNAFSFGFGNEFFSLSDKTRDERRNQLENLKMVIVDEFSLIKADMLYILDLKLREIKMRPEVEFGGVSVFLLGDVLQLRPVRARYLFEEPTNERFQVSFMINSLWEKFDVIMLRKNHRQGEDKEYADLLNKLRKGELTDEGLSMLESRVRTFGHPDLPSDALFVSCTNEEVNKFNEERLQMIDETEHVIEAINQTRSKSQIKPRTDPSGAITGTPLQRQLKLKVGAKVMLTYNIDTIDCLTNGAFGEIIGFKTGNKKQIMQVYVEFYDEDCGKSRRRNFSSLQTEFPGRNVTPIEMMEFHYSLSKKGNISNATVIQFPLKLAFAATAHKVQGMTVKKPNCLVVDLRTVREAAQAYVILSRVQSLSQLFIVESVCSEKIYACDKAMVELERLETVALNVKPVNQTAMISCNIRSLRKNFEDFLRASAIKEAYIICLQETWLDPEDDIDLANMLDGDWNYKNNSVGKGKGITTIYKSEFVLDRNITKPDYQMNKIISESTDVINIYRSTGANTSEILEDIKALYDGSKHTIIMGDFNICYIKDCSHDIYTTLRNLGFKQLVDNPTHIEGSLIDCVFIACPTNEVSHTVSQQAQYYTDHDLIKVYTGNITNLLIKNLFYNFSAGRMNCEILFADCYEEFVIKT